MVYGDNKWNIRADARNTYILAIKWVIHKKKT
jgi:hypothetical protein